MSTQNTLKTSGLPSQAASLLSKLKLTAIFTSRFKMRPETNRELWSVKYQPSRNGVRSEKLSYPRAYCNANTDSYTAAHAPSTI